MIVTHEELQIVVAYPNGEPIPTQNGSPFTNRSLLLEAANYADDKDTVGDSMRMYRLVKRIKETQINHPLDLDENDLEDLGTRGHGRWKANPWLFGTFHTILNKPNLEVMERVESEE